MSTALLQSRLLRDAALGVGYFAIAALTVALTRFGGGVAYLWIAGGLLLSALGTAPRRRWPAMLAWTAAGSLLATGLFGVGWRAAIPLAVINLGEIVLAAALLRRFGGWKDGLDSVGRLARLVAIAGVAMPALSGVAGAATVTWLTGTGFVANWIGWSLAHGLGTLSFAPIFSMIVSGEVRRGLYRIDASKLAEGAILVGLTAVVTGVTFLQSPHDALPTLFLPILPVILATFRAGRAGAALSVMVVTLIGGICTARGLGPIYLMHGDRAGHALLFQLYLASTVLTALPVAADLTRRRDIVQRLSASEASLRDSEAQLRLLTENSTDIVMNVGANGLIRFASPSIAQLGAYDPALMVGRSAIELIVPEDRARVAAVHLNAIKAPDATQIVEFRALTGDGSVRWFEAHTRSVIDPTGENHGVVSAIRDVSHRKAVEAELAREAATDPLTGLANRRAFDQALARQDARGAAGGGHIAIFDIDHFKAVNDRHGHATGDEVLKAFARIARASVREGDLVARLGGEEFGLLLANAGRDSAQIVCNRLRAAFAATAMDGEDGSFSVTASAGIAPLRADVPIAETMELADQALYRAKREGRNRLLHAA